MDEWLNPKWSERVELVKITAGGIRVTEVRLNEQDRKDLSCGVAEFPGPEHVPFLRGLANQARALLKSGKGRKFPPVK